MKKALIFFLVTILLISCDPPRYYDYYMTNSCNEEIEVKLKVCTLNCNTSFSKTKEFSLQINPNETKLIHSDEDFQALDFKMIQYFFKKIIVKKGNDYSKVNYINYNLWDFRVTSKNHADSYLTVKPEDFE
jgi:hypothetical protein